MADQEIKGKDYLIEYDAETQTVTFRGVMRLRTSKDYAPMNDLLRSVHTSSVQGNHTLTLDFRQLKFLNSSGIHALCTFVISMREADPSGMRVIGNRDIYWQYRSLQNLSKLWPKVQVDFV